MKNVSLFILTVLVSLGCNRGEDPLIAIKDDSAHPGDFFQSNAKQGSTVEGRSADVTCPLGCSKKAQELELHVNQRPCETHDARILRSIPKGRGGVEVITLVDLSLIFCPVTLDSNNGTRATTLFFSETEITNQIYAVYLDERKLSRDDRAFAKRRIPETDSTASPVINVQDKTSLWENGAYPSGRGEHPVSFLTLPEAMSFCDWLNERYDCKGTFRLPKEGEWHYAAYGLGRNFPWGNEHRDWTGSSTEPVKARPDLRTPNGLYGMWGNVSEFVLSPSDGYGGKLADPLAPWICKWMGPGYNEDWAQPRQSFWGYTHSLDSRSDTMGFRVVVVPGE